MLHYYTENIKEPEEDLPNTAENLYRQFTQGHVREYGERGTADFPSATVQKDEITNQCNIKKPYCYKVSEPFYVCCFLLTKCQVLEGMKCLAFPFVIPWLSIALVT